MLDRFWSKVEPVAGCWVWTSAKDKDGYGLFQVSSTVTRRAHRLSLQWAIGRQLGPDEMACHTCDNPSCIRPSHLYAGNAKTNTADRMERGSWPATIAKGKRSETLRAMYASGALVVWQAKKTHCKHGHEFTPDNIIYERGGRSRKCRTCKAARQRARAA